MNTIYAAVLLAVSLALVPATARADHERFADFVFPSAKQTLPSEFSRLSNAEYTDILKKIRFQPDACWEYVKNDLPNRIELFRKVDFSGDGADDLIFSSYCMQDEMHNYFWVKEGQGYQYAGMIEGTILKLLRDKTSARPAFVVSKGWRSGAPSGSVTLYAFQKDRSGASFKPQKKVLEFGNLSMPALRMDAVRVAVKKDRGRMRSAPESDNEYDPGRTASEGRLVNGNIIAEFPKGSRGEAVSEFRETNGTVWWFVIMNKDAKAVSHRFRDDQDGHKSGWMDHESLETVR